MENIVEEWRDIIGYEDYLISNYGRAMNKITGKIIKPYQNRASNGIYYCLILPKRFKPNHLQVHRAVARAFPEICGKWFEGCVINHKDCNPSNNFAENLEVCTRRYNLLYNDAVEKRRKKQLNHPNLSKPVAQYTLDGKLVAIYPSTREAGRQTGIHSGSISYCCENHPHYKTAGGFIWRYA